jgi:cytochrome b561
MDTRSITRYGAVTQALHWATALLVLVAFVYGPGGSEQRVYSPESDFDRQLHETLGLCVFVLVGVRVLWRMLDTRPEPVPMPRWMRMASRAIQGALYLLLFALPLTAIAGAWLEGHPLTLLSGVEIPSVLARSHETGTTIANIHTWLGDAILWLAGIHALAALYHHFVLKDGVLASMLPRGRGSRSPGGQ